MSGRFDENKILKYNCVVSSLKNTLHETLYASTHSVDVLW